MNTLSRLKTDLEFTHDLGDIIDVFKTTALIQFNAFQSKIKPNEYFSTKTTECFNELREYLAKIRGNFDARSGLPSAITVVTSDEGFLGELNTLLVNAALNLRKSKQDQIIMFGERGARYLEDLNQAFTFFAAVSDEVRQQEISDIAAYLFKVYREKFGRIIVIYPKFLSLTEQKVEVVQILPYEPSKEPQESTSPSGEDGLIEPSWLRVQEVLSKLWLDFMLLDIFWSSKQSEYAARIMHLEASAQELNHLQQKLAFNYFRQMHALRDNSIREITAANNILTNRA